MPKRKEKKKQKPEESVFSPDPNTPHETLVAMSGAIQENVVFQPHPGTLHETLVEMSKAVSYTHLTLPNKA